ncbi:MAG TPA: winged helix-turn-helix domain-containing protein [Micromonosporaceae bacterium]
MGAVLRDTRRSIVSWCRRHTIGGDGAVVARRPRQRRGEPEPLSRDQELDLIEAIRGGYPDHLELTGELWTRQSVAALIERRYGLHLSDAEVGRYLGAWGLGPRKPTERACGLCVDAVARWVEHEYPPLVRAAEEHQAELVWVGRTRLHGVVPAADVLSAMSIRGRIQFMITTPSVDPPLPREFLFRLTGDPGKPVFAVVDGSFAKSEWPRRLPNRISLHALPSCGRN